MVLLQGNGGNALVIAEVNARLFLVCGLRFALEVASRSASSLTVSLDEVTATYCFLRDV